MKKKNYRNRRRGAGEEEGGNKNERSSHRHTKVVFLSSIIPRLINISIKYARRRNGTQP